MYVPHPSHFKSRVRLPHRVTFTLHTDILYTNTTAAWSDPQDLKSHYNTHLWPRDYALLHMLYQICKSGWSVDLLDPTFVLHTRPD